MFSKLLGSFMRPSLERPFLIDDGETRSLHFTFIHVQSEMRINAPIELVIGYTQAMMAFLLLQPDQQDVLRFGLGGGSLSKFCHFMLPESVVTTVEINPAVIALREFFPIPADNRRFRIIEDDAACYMRHQQNATDIILLDGYNETGLPDALCSPTFYRDCHRALRDDGVLVANFNGETAKLVASLEELDQCFEGRVLVLRPRGSGNTVVMAIKGLDSLVQTRAEQLRHRTGLPLPLYADQLITGSQRWAATDAQPA